jgi:TRAP-type mannitol/chloroaromatic compound transport system substrate-binding protein
VFDAVSEGTAELYHAVPAYWGSKSKGILLFGSQPFGLRADEQFGWLAHGGGQALYDEMYGRFGIKPFLCGNSGPQWGGWFRNEINSAEDLKGLKFRTTGLASEMMAKLGVAAEAMSGPAMFQALQTGALDAGEFIGPWTDSALGYFQVAKNYYWPGVGEPSSAEECGVNGAVYADLPDDLKQAVSFACESLYNPVWTEYTTKHALSLKKLVEEEGVMVKVFPEDVITAMGAAAAEVIDDLRQNDDALVKQITESFVEYRDSVGAYMSYADNGQMNARARILGY